MMMCIYENSLLDDTSPLIKFVIQSPISTHQSYAGIHEFNTIIKIIDGYKPVKIIVSCANMHAKTIVKFISNLLPKGYKFTIHRTIIGSYPISSRIILLRFRLIELDVNK
ncbi:MAG: hypothetical protein AB7V56_07685 [Candidatus Nitrosocosmicus sp.]